MKNIAAVIALLAFISVANCISIHNVSTTIGNSASNESTATTSKPSVSSTPSSFAEGKHEPSKPVGFAKVLADELHAIQTLCIADGHCMNQTEDARHRRAYVKQLWVDILRQVSPFKENPEWATKKAETYMHKSFAAKYILMRLSGFPAKLAMPADDGLFEGDVMLPEYVTDAIVQKHKNNSFLAELRSDAELESVLEANYLFEHHDHDDHDDHHDFHRTMNGTKTTNDERSALRVDKLHSVSWPSNIFYNIDKNIASSDASVVLQAIHEIANGTGGCLTFSKRSTVSEQNLADTIMIQKMPKSSNTSISSCVIASLGKLPFNFLFVNFSCPNIKGEVLHGLMHVLGVVHEHNRVDRDEHIAIQWSKLAPEFFGFFVLDRPEFVSTFGTPFDFSSITMYPQSVGVSKPGDSSFIPKNVSSINASSINASSPIGQRERLSCADVDILRRMYCCAQSCSDSHGICGYWSTMGACAAKESWSWMKLNCPRSCGSCCKIECNPSSSCADYCSGSMRGCQLREERCDPAHHHCCEPTRCCRHRLGYFACLLGGECH